MTPWGEVQSDVESRGNISGLVQMATLSMMQNPPLPFQKYWTMMDNSIVAFDAQNMINFGIVVGSHIDRTHAHSQMLRLAVEAAETEEDLAAIDVEAGWDE
jgi:hypothetical protein